MQSWQLLSFLIWPEKVFNALDQKKKKKKEKLCNMNHVNKNVMAN